MDLSTELGVAREAAREAGKILTRLFGQLKEVRMKDGMELITEADIRAEQAILDTIRRHLPDDSFITEETGDHKRHPERVWIIDPLDGTTNFAHGFPFFATSIGFELDGEMVLGVVYNPQMNEYFEAAGGTGAFLNGNPITVSQTGSLRESLLGFGFPYTIQKEPEEAMRLLARMVVHPQGVRRPGTAAVDLCYVAAGIFDGFWEEGLMPWDTAAGTVILKEAGGRLSTYEGGPYTPHSQTVVASNGIIHEAMLKVLNG
jgi:myo-inositol-1(or 4)-monophosphatase